MSFVTRFWNHLCDVGVKNESPSTEGYDPACRTFHKDRIVKNHFRIPRLLTVPLLSCVMLRQQNVVFDYLKKVRKRKLRSGFGDQEASISTVPHFAQFCDSRRAV